jgi:hypothetical protein
LMMVFLTSPMSIFAKAPVTPGHSFEREWDKKMRYPAAHSLHSFEMYIDMSCKDFVDFEGKDGFVTFFKSELKLLAGSEEAFCERVNSQSQNFLEEDLAQAQHEFIGEGTFSKLKESKYIEYKYNYLLDFYQNLGCAALIDENSHDEFVVFFRKYTENPDDHFCQLMDDGDSSEPLDNEAAEFKRTYIGKGTFAKMVNDAFNQFYYQEL